MSIENAKFTSTEFTGKDVASLPDNPSAEGISAAELKARFDNVGKMMVALGKHNVLIDALTSSVAGDSGAKGIGVEAIAGVAGVDVQTVLANLKALSAADKAELLAKYAEYVPKADISQVLGMTATKIPSEKAVTDAMASAGYGDMLKSVYDAGGSGVVDDAERLGGQLPTYYAKKAEVDAAQGTANAAAKITDLMLIGNRGQRNDANNIPNGVTWCDTGTPHNAHSFVWQIQYDSSDKVQLSILCNKGIGAIAYRSSVQNSWSAWVEMMPMTGGSFSGTIAAPRFVSGSIETDTYFHILANEGLRVANKPNTEFAPAAASAFNVISSKSVKTDITEYAGALDKINSAKIYKYTRTDDGAQQIGLITEDATTPAELKREIEKPNGNGEKPRARAAAKPEMTETIDLYSFISLVSQAVKELKTEKDAEIEVLKSKITALEGK